jgi:hypothetical protein
LSVAGKAAFSATRNFEGIAAAILILAKSCSSSGNACTVMTSEKAKRAGTVEKTGVV